MTVLQGPRAELPSLWGRGGWRDAPAVRSLPGRTVMEETTTPGLGRCFPCLEAEPLSPPGSFLRDVEPPRRGWLHVWLLSPTSHLPVPGPADNPVVVGFLLWSSGMPGGLLGRGRPTIQTYRNHGCSPSLPRGASMKGSLEVTGTDGLILQMRKQRQEGTRLGLRPRTTDLVAGRA